MHCLSELKRNFRLAYIISRENKIYLVFVLFSQRNQFVRYIYVPWVLVFVLQGILFLLVHLVINAS
jgi:hypothetical protein